MAVSFKLDQSGLRDGLRRRLAATKRAASDVSNKAARNVCLRAAQLTPKANTAEIKAQLTTGGLAMRLLQSRSFQSRLPAKLQGFTRGTHSRAQIDEAARQLVALRARTAAYIKSGWRQAAQFFGSSPAAKAGKSLAGQSYGTKATAGRPGATGVNLARGATQVGGPALQKALDFVGRDLTPGAEKQLASAFNK